MRVVSCLLSLLIVIVMIAAGCERGAPSSGSSGEESSDASTAPARIVSLAPSVTETLFALDAGSRVVGVTRYCDYPQAAADLPKIGGLTDPDLESILALRPELVIGVASNDGQNVEKKLEAAGIEALFVSVENLTQTYEAITTIGKRIGEPRAARRLVSLMRTSLEPVATKANAGPRVLVVFGHDPMVAAGPDTFADELVRRAGGKNVLAGMERAYPVLDVEKLYELDPEIIIDTSVASSGSSEFWKSFERLQAVAEQRVYRLEDPALMRPGPRLPQAYLFFQRAVRGSP